MAPEPKAARSADAAPASDQNEKLQQIKALEDPPLAIDLSKQGGGPAFADACFAAMAAGLAP